MRKSKTKHKISTISMKDKLCVVSGSTAGIGKAIIERFAMFGAHIVMVVRNVEKAKPIKEAIEEKYHVPVDIIYADFSKFDTIRVAAKEINEKYNRIDVLVNSVGIYSTQKTFNENQIEKVFAINHLGIFLFTKLLLDKLKKSVPSKIIQINSIGHTFSNIYINDYNFDKRLYSGMRSYGASKTAQIYTVKELSERLVDTGVTINAVHPGSVKTKIGDQSGWLFKLFMNIFTRPFFIEPHISAEAIHYLVTSEEFKDTSGEFINLTTIKEPAKHTQDKQLQKDVWKLSMKLTGLEEGI